MNITKENIEAVLYDYAEGNLSAEDRKATEQFLISHPEYKELSDDYDALLTVPVENDVVFGQTDELVKQIVANDGRLTDEDRLPIRTTGRKIVLISKYIKWISACAAAIALFVVIKGYGDFVNGPNTELITKNTSAKGQSLDAKEDGTDAESRNIIANRPTDTEKRGYFSQKEGVFSSKRGGVFDSETTSGNNETANGKSEISSGNDKINSTYDEITNGNSEIINNDSETKNLYANNDVLQPKTNDLSVQNEVAEEESDFLFEDLALNDGQSEEIDESEYRILILYRKPSAWKRFKYWLAEVFA